MSSLKRSRPAALLERRVRPRKEEDSDVEGVENLSQDSDSDTPSEDGLGESASEDESADDHSESPSEDESQEEEEEDEDEEAEAAPKVDISQISFGALAKAHASISSGGGGKKNKKSSAAHDLIDSDIKQSIAERQAARDKAAVAAAKRSSKHAPMEVTSKKPVSRKRDIVEIPKSKARDPRFDPIPGMPETDEVRARKAYAFLDEYRETELQALKAVLKKEKDGRKQERMKREILSMESKKKTQERKDRERAVIEEHRKKEKELVKQGKQPFYLKRSEQKKQVLVEQFKGLSKKKVEHVIERRRKKLAHKEKKDLPYARRGAEGAEEGGY
ncbi:hypothetical protein GE09DRAFT_1124503 [Coniochaeta sp. 2T2.1]|nr:hypothetical protein GE09DRAFT_1124503 [Coniochaeta sp. 2T2.1]